MNLLKENSVILRRFSGSGKNGPKWLAQLIMLALGISPWAQAEIVTDGSAGQQTSLSGNMMIPESLGTVSGNNLFHSFDRFNINRGESATFTAESVLNNVISRVTGGSPSAIDGPLSLQAPGSPAFFLINPSGVVFREGAEIDVPGAFHVSTSSKLIFEDGTELHADLIETSVFSSAEPEAFGFLDDQAGIIKIDEASFVSSSDANLSLTATGLDIDGTVVNGSGDIRLHAQGAMPGRVEIDAEQQPGHGDITMQRATVGTDATVSAPAGSIHISGGDISLSDQTYIDSKTEYAGQESGSISLIARGDLTIDNGSRLGTFTYGGASAGDIHVSASAANLDGAFNDTHPTGIFSVTVSNGFSGAVSLDVETQLNIEAGALVSAETYAGGNAGQVSVNSDVLVIDGAGFSQPTGIFSYSEGPGNAARINVLSAGEMILLNGGIIGSESWSEGNAGQVTAIADNILISQANGLITGIYSDAYDDGNGGNVFIESHADITIFNGGFISSVTFGDGDAGNVAVQADGIYIDDYASPEFSGITTQTQSAGTAGNIVINAGQIELYGDAYINSDSLSDDGVSLDNPGNAGDVTITAGNIWLETSTISSSTETAGSAGNISIEVENALELFNGASIDSKTTLTGFGGNAGSVFIRSGSVCLFDASSVSSNSEGSGQAGLIIVTALDLLELTNTSFITSSANGSGDAGSVIISAGDINLTGSGYTTAVTGIGSDTTGSGDGGIVDVQASGTLELVSGGQISSITFGAGNAGNVDVQAQAIVIDRDNGETFTGIISQTQGAGDAGKVVVNVDGNLSLYRGGNINSNTFTQGDAGSVEVYAQNVYLNADGADPDLTSTAISSDTSGPGNAGSVYIDVANNLEVVYGASISSQTSSLGDAGSVEIHSGNIYLDHYLAEGFTGITSQTSAEGNAGSVIINNAGLISIYDGAYINSNTFGAGNAGGVEVTSAQIEIIGYDSGNGTAISSDAGTIDNSVTDFIGSAGNVTITAVDYLYLADGASVSSASYALGAAGVVSVTATDVIIDGSGADKFTGIYSNTYGPGDAGSVALKVAGGVFIDNEGFISSVTFGSGNAGTVEIESNNIVINNALGSRFAGITSQSQGDGDGGSVYIYNYGSIELVDGAYINSSAFENGDAGTVNIRTEHLVINGQNSKTSIGSNAYGTGNAGSVDIVVSGDLDLVNGASISSATYSSGNAGSVSINAGNIYLDRYGSEEFTGITSLTESEGNAGTVVINNAGLLSVYDGASINSSTYGPGNAGGVEVTSAQIEIFGFDSDDDTAISSDAGTIDNSVTDFIGSAGNVTITAVDYLYLADGASVSSASYALGAAGVVSVTATDVFIDGSGADNLTGIYSDTYGPGDAGSVALKVAGGVFIDNEGFISSVTFGSGNAGTVEIESSNIVINNALGSRFAGITSQTQGDGEGGDVTIYNRETIELVDGAYINSSAFENGDAGTVNVETGYLLINGGNSTAAIGSDAFSGQGDAGTVSINVANTLQLISQGNISSSTFGPGKAGTINITSGQLLMEGEGSAIVASASDNLTSSGQTGSLLIKVTDLVSLKNRARISIENNAYVVDPAIIEPADLVVDAGQVEITDAVITAASTGNVDASDIIIRPSDGLNMSAGYILTAAQDGNGGRVSITGAGLLFLDDAVISTSVNGVTGNGGNILIDMDALALDTGFIQANTLANDAFGGDILIQAPVLAASASSLIAGGDQQLEFLPGYYGFNVIQAAAPDGVSGNIDITAPNLDLSGSLNVLGIPFFDSGGLGRNPCETTYGSSFSLAGRGALPVSTEQPLSIISDDPGKRPSSVNCVL